MDFESLTLDELELLETMSGKTLSELMEGGMMSARVIKTLHWINARRTDPNADFANFGSMKVGEAVDKLGDAADPKES